MHSSTSPQPATHSVLASGERLPQDQIRLDWEIAHVQRALMAAREKYGYALCACRRDHLKLQIRLREGKLHLAVWPGEGPSHDTECLYFRDELADSVSPIAKLRDPTPHSQPPRSGEPLPFSGGKRIPLTLGNKSTQPAAGETVVNVRGLLIRLWEAASLCRWHPGWTRDWGRTRFQLLRGATEFTVNGQAAEDLIFVPRPYRASLQAKLNAEWDSLIASCAARSGGEARIVIAPVRRLIAPSKREEAHVLLRHLHVPIALSGTCFDFVQRDCRNSLSNSRSGEPDERAPRPELIGIFSVERTHGRGGLIARAGWMLPVHPASFIPAPNSDTVLLIDQLIAGRYAFQHLVSEVQPSKRATPDWLVRHVRGPQGEEVARAALDLIDRGATSEYQRARADLAQRMADQGVPTWTWLPAGRRGERIVPPLPPHDYAALPSRTQILADISRSPNADYRHGPTTKFNVDERKSA